MCSQLGTSQPGPLQVLRDTHSADARAIALTPDLLPLVADLADYVEHMEEHWGGGIAGSRALLARVVALADPGAER